MSKYCSKYCFADWFEDAKYIERRLCEIYYNDLGPISNEEDADLIQFLGFVPAIHTSVLVAGELGTESAIRKNTFRFYGEPEALEAIKNENLKPMAIREMRDWCDAFENAEVEWHPFYLKLAETLKKEGDTYHFDKIKNFIEQEKS